MHTNLSKALAISAVNVLESTFMEHHKHQQRKIIVYV